MEKQNIGMFAKTFISTFAIFIVVLLISSFFFFKQYVDVYKSNIKTSMIAASQLLMKVETATMDSAQEESFVNEYWNTYSERYKQVYFSVTSKDGTTIGMYPTKEKFQNYAKKHQKKVVTANFKLNSGYSYSINFYIKSSAAILDGFKDMPLLWASLIIIGFIISYLSAHAICQPIEMLTKETERLKDVNESPKMIIRTDEIGTLQESIYDLHMSLRNYISDLETEMGHISSLEASQRYFFAAASQEFKAPIASINAIFDTIEKDLGSNEYIAQKLKDCRKRINQLSDLITEIVDIVKYNDSTAKIPTETININNMVQECLDELSPISEKKHLEVFKNVDPGVSIDANPSMFARVMKNVISNAITHADDNKSVSIWIEQDSKFATLFVYNECAPIPEEVISKLFEPFYQREDVEFNNERHSGLGLYIVQELLGRMNIAFDMKNRQNGICFTIRFKKQINA